MSGSHTTNLESLPKVPPVVPICAIGASAGGVVALQDFFSNIRTDLGLAYVVIVHLSPDHPSQLNEILATRTSMPVETVAMTARLKPGHVYIIPPDRELVIEGDDLAARPFGEPRGRRAPIDLFFRSVATGRGDGIAVVLSGSGSDGALGSRAIKAAGGVVFVQDAAEAEYPMMPRSTIATGVADFVAPIPRLTERIAQISRDKAALRQLNEEDVERDIRQILGLIRECTGHDFVSYKRATVMRRLFRRMQISRCDTLNTYFHYLHTNAEEIHALFSDFLISVTMFFREPEAFTALTETVIKSLLDYPDDEASIRVWVVACATGEEAYSLGILLIEEAERRKRLPTIQIFASDIDEGALAIAREGRYPKAIEADVSEERLRRFFVEDGAYYVVRKELRDLVLFAAHSALKDPPFIKLDLISCRNLLIYLQRDLQAQLSNLFHYALKPGGVLFLGSAETIDPAPALFTALDREARIYRARPFAERLSPALPQLSANFRFFDRERRTMPTLPQPAAVVALAHSEALEQAAPPSALVDTGQTILHLSPKVGRFFLPSAGPFVAELPAQVRPELRIDLKLGLRRALEEGESTLTVPTPVAFNGHKILVAMHIVPLTGASGAVAQAIVFFLEGGRARDDGDLQENEDVNLGEVRRLRHELSAAQDGLRDSRFGHEQAMEDLRAANEELQSINEEYRSTAEELETSKEELQSMNEELQTVNAELKSKLEAISSAHNDLQNLMAATEIGTLFLDTELRIKLFTPAVANHFNITNADIGRSISDFTHRLVYDGVESSAAAVLKGLVPFETEVRARNGAWLMMRLRPYRTIENRIEGVVATFADITERKRAEDALADELRAMKRLQQFSTRVVETGELEALLTLVLETAMDILGADFGNIQLLDDQTHRLRTVAHRGFDQRFLEHLTKVEAGVDSANGLALRTNRQVVIDDVETDAAFAPNLEEARAAGFRAVQSKPLVTTDGKIIGIMSAHFRQPRTFSEHERRLMDICARHAADTINGHLLQQTVRDSETRLRKVLETDAIAVLFFDNSGTLVDTNDAFLRMTGYARAEVEGRSLTWRRMTPPEWIGVSEQRMAEVEQTGRIAPYEKEYFNADGSRRWMMFTGRRIESNLLAEYGIDISDRKLAEQERELLSRELRA